MTLLARGRDAAVFTHSPGRVLRRYARAADTAREVAVMDHARDHGYPVPFAEALSDTDILLERIDGPTMLDDLALRPWRVFAHARTLADLHRRLHAIEAPRWLPPFGDGDALLHLDLHPRNVLLGPRGPSVIDWANARRGRGEADVAHAWVILTTSEIDGVTGVRAVVLATLRAVFAHAFLAGFDRAAIARVVPMCARARLADRNLRERERPRVRRLARV
jgi:aminoglycoside phosphotransferase (APT) family kinase protein